MIFDTSQQKAIYQPLNNSIFITAPPGYGKTYVMAERIKYTISSDYIRPPNKLLALTFSNAAANEMKDRIRNIPNSQKYVDIMNFHTLAYHILRTYGNYIGINRSFTIINEKEKYNLKRNYFEKFLSEVTGATSNKISELINDYNKWYNEKFLKGKEDDTDNYKIFDKLRIEIKNRLIDNENLDFDHLLFKSIDLLRKYPNVKDCYFDKYKVLLADEFQDTNYVQYLLFKEIASNSDGIKRSVFVVGDKKQAVMKFQGANPDNIDLLIKEFNCDELDLKKNHRTNSEKIKAITKRLRQPELIIDPCITCKMYIDDTVEGESSRIINIINSLLKESVKAHDICLLFPQLNTSNPIKRKFDEESIDYILINNFKFESIVEEYPKIFEMIRELIKKRYNKKSVNTIVKGLVKKYYQDRFENNLVLITIEKFSKAFDKGNYSSMEVWERLQEFYNCLQMEIDWTNLVRSNIRNKIFLSTIHGSKGLEFDYILMLGIVNFRMPYWTLCIPCSNFNDPKKVDTSDAKDLFYVGVSRSIKDIYFFFSEQDEQNLSKKNRKISCVFHPLLASLKFIDNENNEYSFHDNEIQRHICVSRVKESE